MAWNVLQSGCPITDEKGMSTGSIGPLSTAANQLNQLAADFTNASKSGQLPNVQDLAQAVGGHHHHHHAHAAASADSDAASGPDSSSSSPASPASIAGASQMLNQLPAAFQATAVRSGSLNPMSIIMSTLSTAWISGADAR
jgi:hypothetical protein